MASLGPVGPATTPGEAASLRPAGPEGYGDAPLADTGMLMRSPVPANVLADLAPADAVGKPKLPSGGWYPPLGCVEVTDGDGLTLGPGGDQPDCVAANCEGGNTEEDVAPDANIPP